MKQGTVLDVLWVSAKTSIANAGANSKRIATIKVSFAAFPGFVDVLLTPVVHPRGVD
jgi:hypothetical protein